MSDLAKRREFQANAFFSANGFSVRMISDAKNKTLLVITNCMRTAKLVDQQVFSFEDPADVAAAFAKYSNSVTWAVTHEVDEVATSGM